MSITSVQNKVVIITGCSSGIGLATARLFLERQALVFGIDVGAIPQKLADEHKTFTFHQANLTQSRAVDDAVSRCHQQHGRVDVLVNCAGISDGWSSADTVHEDEWERVMAINLTVPIRLMKAVLPLMKEQKGGSIINVASKAGTSGAAAGIAYTASKHGLVRFAASKLSCAVAHLQIGWRNKECSMAFPSGGHSMQQRTARRRCDKHCVVSADGAFRFSGI
jgi:NAD(P)-dependent dehydrogenase (short-subunit alcohol dehydrogenase family)